MGIGSGKKVAFKSQVEIEAKAKHILTIIDKRHTNRKSIVLEFTQNPEKLALGANEATEADSGLQCFLTLQALPPRSQCSQFRVYKK